MVESLLRRVSSGELFVAFGGGLALGEGAERGPYAMSVLRTGGILLARRI